MSFPMKRFLFHVGAFVLFAALGAPAFAWPPKYGAEFTFKPVGRNFDYYHDTNLMNQAVVAQCAKLKLKCTSSVMAGIHTRYDVEMPNGDKWYFNVANDPGVVEIQTKPATIAEMQARQKVMDDLIFGSAKSVGLEPDVLRGTGCGHMHLDFTETFGGDAKLLRNFMVDYANHPELTRVFGFDKYNAPALFDLQPSQRAAFAKVIQEFDHSVATGFTWDIGRLVQEIEQQVYTATPEFGEPLKYQAISLKRIRNPVYKADEKTIEIRALGPQANTGEFVTEARLFEARIDYLRKQGGLLPYNQNVGVAPGMMADNFMKYVQECGLDVEFYSQYVRNFEVQLEVVKRLPPPKRVSLMAKLCSPLKRLKALILK